MATVAVGVANGRIVTLCDHGRVMALDNVYSPDASDHHEHAAKGLTFARGMFFHATGHGAPGHLFRSTDGLEWEKVDDDHLHYLDGTTGPLTGGTDSVFFAEDRFVLSLSRRRLFSDDGIDWYETAEPLSRDYSHFCTDSFVRALGAHFQHRQFSADPDMVWFMRSDDQGDTYREVPEAFGCLGRVVYAHGATFTPGEEAPCLSMDGGETWAASALRRENPSSFLPVDDGFIAFRGQRRGCYHSTDLETWEEVIVDADMRTPASGRAPEGY